MAHDDDNLTSYEEHLRDDGTREDYNREAYGDPCPCGRLRWGGDCGHCMADDDDAPYGVLPPAAPSAERSIPVTAHVDVVKWEDDDIPF